MGSPCPIPSLPDLSIPIVDPKRDCGGIEQQQELILKHLLFQALNGPALSFVGFLQGTEDTDGFPHTQTPLITQQLWHNFPLCDSGFFSFSVLCFDILG